MGVQWWGLEGVVWACVPHVADVVGGGGHVWMCRDGGSGNGHGGGRLLSLCYFMKKIISQEKKKKKKEENMRETKMHLEPSSFIVHRPRWCWWCVDIRVVVMGVRGGDLKVTRVTCYYP